MHLHPIPSPNSFIHSPRGLAFLFSFIKSPLHTFYFTKIQRTKEGKRRGFLFLSWKLQTLTLTTPDSATSTATAAAAPAAASAAAATPSPLPLNQSIRHSQLLLPRSHLCYPDKSVNH